MMDNDNVDIDRLLVSMALKKKRKAETRKYKIKKKLGKK